MKLSFALLLLLCAGLAIWGAGEARGNEKLRAGDVARQYTIDSLKNQVAQLTIAAEKVDTVWRARKARVDTLRDTLNIHDTVAVKVYVAATDSALKSCSELADTCAAQRRASAFLVAGMQGEINHLRKRLEFGPRFQWSVQGDRSLVVGDLRIAADADVRLLGRIHGYGRAEHTFGYPPRSDLRVGIRARP